MAIDPVARFNEWLEEARAAGVAVPESMALATVDAEGQPSARMLLLKGADENGFTFFSGYESRKGRELDQVAYQVAGPVQVRELLGDGVFQGTYALPDDQVARVWEVGVEEIRELLESAWR